MKKVVFKVDKFTDFTGTEREVIFAAVSLDTLTTEVFFDNGKNETEIEPIAKELRIGIAVQNRKDLVANTELGKIIAEGKAMKDKTCFGKLFSTDKGFVNKVMVEALLTQEMDYFKQNPGKYLKGYNHDKELFANNPNAYLNKLGIVPSVFEEINGMLA